MAASSPTETKRNTTAAALQVGNFSDSQNALNLKKDGDTHRRLKYLIGLTDLFRHFLDAKAEKDPSFKKIITNIDNERTFNSKSKNNDSKRHRKTEKEEDAELLIEEEDEDSEPNIVTVFTESPPFVMGKMRDYQIQGLNWLISLYQNGISGILADEMGLGKTLQTISFLGYLRYVRDISGPHLVIVPKSTLDNWAREFAKWTPDVHILVLQGLKEERNNLIQLRLIPGDFDVCITSYEMVLREKSHLKKFAWEYIVIDEAHRIKNEESSLSQIMRTFNSRHRLLITGTPLQNNLHELWALLNYILPDVFGDSEAFDKWFESQNGDQDKVVQQLHKVLSPFLLRRVKSEVEKSLLPKKETNIYVGMSEMQVKWYQKILEKDIDAVNGAVGKRESKTRLLNIVMQLRKCCNHPYLFEGAEPGPPYTTDEHLVFNAGKMIILDKLLKAMKAKGSRVLIFSQMSRLLDILEDYCVFREYEYCRIDGQTDHQDRITAIDEYNAPGSSKFVFLLTTRAGGLGINLTSADIVVLYDSDWNPQADLQAMDRAHRIGQTKQVYVYRFVTDKAIEEKVLERAAQKLRLDQLVIQQGRTSASNSKNGSATTSGATSKDDLLNMIQHGAQEMFEKKSGTVDNDLDFDDIVSIGQKRTSELNKKYESLGIEDLQKFTSESAYQWNGENFKNKQQNNNKIGFSWINPAKRERKEQTYSVDRYYKGVLYGNNNDSDTESRHSTRTPRPKQVNIQDHQFYPARLMEIYEKEMAYFRKQQGYKVPPPTPSETKDKDNLKELEAERAAEQAEIDNATPLTEEEEAEKNALSHDGYSNWARREFLHLISLMSKYGRNNISDIADEFPTKTEEEIRDYCKTFWKRYTEINDHERFISQIEAGEERLKKIQYQGDLLHKKVMSYRSPLQQMQIVYPLGNSKRVYSEMEDRFLLVCLDKIGLDTPNLYERIREEIRISPLFRFDWFFLSRTSPELSRRCNTLLTAVVREMSGSKEGTLDGRSNPKQRNSLSAKDTSISNGAVHDDDDDLESIASNTSTSRLSTPVASSKRGSRPARSNSSAKKSKKTK